MESPTGKKLGRYKVLTALGTGGMGEVFLAEDADLRRKVALKLLPQDVSSDKERLRRFQQEAYAASALNHPNILTIYEFAASDGTHFLATEYVDGKTLRQKLQSDELSLGEAVGIAEQIAFALSVAHAAGIIHRDLKPENIMIRGDGIVKILDFGLAKLIEKQAVSPDTEADTRALVKTNPGIVMGTVSYMSPEQARGKDTDDKTDIWSLGVLLFEMVSGKLPFAGETVNDVIASILTKEQPSLYDHSTNVPVELEKILRLCLQKNREARYRSITELHAQLKDLRQDLELEAKLERSTSPNRSRIQPLDENRPTVILEADNTADRTLAISTKSAIAHSPSSAEYIAGEIKQHKAISLAILSILLLSGLGFLYWFSSHRSKSNNARQINSIAVLPFENSGGNSEMEYFSDGITESLINSLSQLPNTKVIARSSVFRYKGKDLDLAQVAKELSVQAIINGRVVQRGDTLSISVDLMDVQNNTQLWGRQFTRKSSDTLALQDDIARQVTEALRVRLTGVEEERIRKRPTYNEEAYKLYLQGRYFWNRRTIEDFKTAIPFFQKAIELDPQFALAYSGLSDSYNLLATYSGVQPKETMPLAKAAALKALALDDNLAEAHGSLGQYLIEYEHDFPGAEREFKRAIDLNPNYASAYQWHAELLYSTGRFDEAKIQALRAVELDPLSRIINSVVARASLFARKYDEAIALFRKNIELNPDWSGDYEYLFHAYAAKGMYPEAVDAYINFLTFAKVAEVSEIKATKESFTRSGWQGFLQHRVKYLELSSKRQYVNPRLIAELYAYLGEKDQAFVTLEKAYEMRTGLLELRYLCSADNLRSDPRFDNLMRRIGFSQ